MGRPKPTDALGSAAALGDGLADLFRAHAEGLAGAVRGVLGPGAEHGEVLQEAFLRAWRALSRGDRPDDPVAWIFVVTLNLARDLRRRRARRRAAIELDEVRAVELLADEPEPASSVASREALAAARDAIFRLSDDEKEVFLLRVSGELPFEAIGRALGIPAGTAKSRMRAALRELRRRLRAFAPDGPAPASDPSGHLGAKGITR